MSNYDDKLRFAEGVCCQCQTVVPLMYAAEIPVPIGERWAKQDRLERTEAPHDPDNYMCVTHAYCGVYCDGSGNWPQALVKGSVVTAKAYFINHDRPAIDEPVL